MKIPLNLFLYLIKEFLEGLEVENDIAAHMKLEDDEIVNII
jgi:hypothetical protein